MVYVIPKARMHSAERWAVAGGLALVGLGVAAASHLIGNSLHVISALSLVSTLAVALNPADRLSYLVGPDGLRVGRLVLPFAEMTAARVVKLDGTMVYAGLTLPGYWCGRAWAPHLGRFHLRGSTGLGQGVLITMADGHRVVLTPANPVSLVVHLHTLMRMRRQKQAPALP